MTAYSLANYDVLSPDSLQDMGTRRLGLSDIFNKLIGGSTIVIPKYEQSLGGDVYVKLTEDTYPRTEIAMYYDSSGPTAWQDYAISIDALSTYPCYEYTDTQALVNPTLKYLNVGTILKYTKDNKGNTSSITGVYFLPESAVTTTTTTFFPGTTTTTTLLGYARDSKDLDGKNLIQLSDGSYQSVDFRYNTDVGDLIDINVNIPGYYSSIPESWYSDFAINSDDSGASTDTPEAPIGVILYTLDNQDGYFAIVASDEQSLDTDSAPVTL